MQSLSPRTSGVIFALLALLMGITRGLQTQLPDASWAVFLLGGFYLRAWWPFALLFLEAVLVDWSVVRLAGVSDYCFTPAYIALLPSQAVLWLGGSWYASRHRLAVGALLSLAVACTVSVCAAFLISNAGFYLLSGHFADMTVAQYAGQVRHYLPGYFTVTVSWLAMAAGVHIAIALFNGRAGYKLSR